MLPQTGPQGSESQHHSPVAWFGESPDHFTAHYRSQEAFQREVYIQFVPADGRSVGDHRVAEPLFGGGLRQLWDIVQRREQCGAIRQCQHQRAAIGYRLDPFYAQAFLDDQEIDRVGGAHIIGAGRSAFARL